MTSVDEIIEGVIEREGGGKVTNDPVDKGGRTQYGISEKSNPAAWADGKVTADEARAIYLKKYVEGPGFDKVVDRQLQTQLIDFGVNSGPSIAIKKLQQVVGTEQDGVLGPETLAAVNSCHADDVNTSLVILRVKMIGQIVVKNPAQLRFLNGWLDRALQFLG
jgi:lysozyme family protein